MENAPIKPLRDKDITTCITQLAARARELGEDDTFIVLATLAGHRVVGADHAMAISAGTQAAFLVKLMLTQGVEMDDPDHPEGKSSE